jgi:ribosomal protein L11
MDTPLTPQQEAARARALALYATQAREKAEADLARLRSEEVELSQRALLAEAKSMGVSV